MSEVFGSVVVPSVEQVPLLEITQAVDADDLKLIASYEISQTVLTEFDKRLSDHLAATKGYGFPSLSLTIKITDAETGKDWSPANQTFYQSLPHALRRVAEFALGERESTPITIFARSRALAGKQALGRDETLSREKVGILTAAIDFCDMLGEYEFLHISGGFQSLVVQPTDRSIGSVVLDLERGTIAFPSEYDGPGFVCALINPVKAIAENPAATAYLNRAHHSQALAKEKAIWDFRSVAEERIFGFDKALDGQPISDYRLTAVETLVARLRAGLGDNLLGLSEQAQITALGWARLARQAKETAALPGAVPNKSAGRIGTTPSPVRLISID